MAIVQAGKTFNKDDLKKVSGDISTHLRNLFQQGEQLRAQLATWTDADLIALGLTQDEINAIKGFFIGDLPAIRTSFNNASWLPKLLGLGV